MQLTVTDGAEGFFSVQVDPDQSIEDVKAILEVESGIPIASQLLYHNSKPILGGTIASCGLADQDLVLLQRKPAAGGGAAAGGGGSGGGARVNPNDPRAIREAARTDPHLMTQLRRNNPALAAAAANEDPQVFIREWSRLMQEKEMREEEEMKRRARLVLDPLDPLAQQEIEKDILKEIVNENMEAAMEHNPEVFGSVCMLYIDCEVNNHPLKAFVDSGAQSTIMSQECARRCGVMHLVDERFSGIAQGVGTSRIIGRVHAVAMKIGGAYLQVSLTVLENGIDLLFGLDNLKRHQCCIDLKDNVLRFNNEAGTVVHFLPEHQIPEHMNNMNRSSSSASDAAAISDEDLPTVTTTTTTTSSSSAGAGGSVPSVPAVSGVGLGLGVGAGSGGVTGADVGDAAAKAAAALAAAFGAAGSGAAASASGSIARPSTAGSVASLPPGVTEEKVQRIVALGFGREQAIRALQSARGNEEVAAGLLFGM